MSKKKISVRIEEDLIKGIEEVKTEEDRPSFANALESVVKEGLKAKKKKKK